MPAGTGERQEKRRCTLAVAARKHNLPTRSRPALRFSRPEHRVKSGVNTFFDQVRSDRFMRVLASVLFAGLALAGCQQAPTKSAEEPQAWQPSTLKEQTLDQVNAGLRVYQQCVNDQTRAHLNDDMDSRKITDVILKDCEDKLSAIKGAFDAEQVPASISERYLRSKRSMAAQQILRVVMATQAVRSTAPGR
jgi:hypothetical protein